MAKPRIVPHLIARAFVSTLFGLLRWLTGSLWGYFLLSLALLLWIVFLTDLQPFTATELLLWFDSLDDDNKASIAVALITVLGFLIAFQTGYENSRRERLMSKEIEAADDIDSHYAEFQDNARELMAFAGQIVSGYEDDDHDGSGMEVTVQYLLSEAPDLRRKQMRLVNLAILSHLLVRKWSYVILRHLNLYVHVEMMAEMSAPLSAASHFIPKVENIPAGLKPIQILQYFSQQHARNYLVEYDTFNARIHWPLSHVTTVLRGKVTRDNLSTFINGIRVLMRGD